MSRVAFIPGLGGARDVQRIVFTDYLETTTAVVVPCGGPKSLPVHQYSVVIFTYSGPLGSVGFNRFI